MKRLLRILVATRGLILAGTLTLAVAGSYLDRGAAPAAGHGNPASAQILGGQQVQPSSTYDACAQPDHADMGIVCPYPN